MKISVCSSNQNKFFGSKSGIRCLFDPWIWDPGFVIRIRIQDGQPGSYFRELKKQFFGFKIHKIFDADPGWNKFGSGMEKKVGYGIRDKHPDWQH
jgi:hypothetical protein